MASNTETCYRLDKEIYGYELAVDLYHFIPSYLIGDLRYSLYYDNTYQNILTEFLRKFDQDLNFYILNPEYQFIGKTPNPVDLPNEKLLEYQPIIQRSNLGNYDVIVGYGCCLTLEDQSVTPIFKRSVVLFEKANDWMLLKLSMTPNVV